MLDGTKHFDCSCGSPQHTLRFVLDFWSDDHLPTIYTDLQMAHYLPWYKRTWVAIKYIFGYDTVDHYGSWELDAADADKMIAMLTEYKEANAKYLASNVAKAKTEKREPFNASTLDELYGGAEYEQTTRD